MKAVIVFLITVPMFVSVFYAQESQQLSMLISAMHNLQRNTKHSPLAEFSLDIFNAKLDKFKEFTSTTSASFIAYNEYIGVVNRFTTLLHEQMKLSSKWLAGIKPVSESRFNLFVQKKIVPSVSTIVFWGDLHGSVHSLVRSLMYLKNKGFIADNLKLHHDVYFIYLGDYVDRGVYGAEIVYLLMCLKLKNPNQVYMTQGNHEEYEFNTVFDLGTKAVFQKQLLVKFPDDPEIDKKIYQAFKYLPSALFLGVRGKEKSADIINYIQCNHGAFEIGYNAKAFLNSTAEFEFIPEIQRQTIIEEISDPKIKQAVLATIQSDHRQNFIPQSIITKLPTENKPSFKSLKIGFNWHEFIATGDYKKVVDTVSGNKLDREIVYGKPLTEYLFKIQSSPKNILRAIIRGHQHHDHMLNNLRAYKGFFYMWNKSVMTLFSAPTNFSRPDIFPFDAFTVLYTNPNFVLWKWNSVALPIKHTK